MGHAKAITLQSGTELDGPVDPRVTDQTMYRRVEKEPYKASKKSQIEEPIVDNKQETITK